MNAVNQITIPWARFFRVADTDEILTRYEVYNAFLQYCEDSDNMEELADVTREYNAKLDRDVTLFDMYLLRVVSAGDLIEMEAKQ